MGVAERLRADCFFNSGEGFLQRPRTDDLRGGAYGGPMYREWDFDPKTRPNEEDLEKWLADLALNWSDIVGHELGRSTKPLKFTGEKARRLLVSANAATRPPWGNWNSRSQIEDERWSFTRFRSAINNAISPHEVDHIDFLEDSSYARSSSSTDTLSSGS